METATTILSLAALAASVGSLVLSLWTTRLMDEAERRQDEANAEAARRMFADRGW